VTDIDRRRAAFGDRLRKLRARAGFLTGDDFATHLGWQQSRVSRMETGSQTATDVDVIAWCNGTNTSESVASELLDELREIRIEAASWRRQLRTGHAAAVRIRMQRQHVLYDSDRSIELLVAESALHYPVGPPEVMAAQFDRLLTVCGLSTVRFGIVPQGTETPVIPMHGFWIMDDRSVVVETVDSEITAEDPADIALYHRVMDELWTVAAEGTDARAILGRLAAETTIKR
jgi:transcriptional regulator with XRE-family HTH domain